MILYLHGFRSSPKSMKARLVGERMAALGLADQLVCPQLPASPKAVMVLAGSLIEGVQADELSIVGSSLGGDYRTWLAHSLGARAVLPHPAHLPAQQP